MGGDKPDIRKLTDAAQSPDKGDDALINRTLDGRKDGEIRQAMQAMVNSQNPNMPELSIKYREDDQTKPEALMVKVERSYMNPARWFGDKYTQEEVYRPPSETTIGKVREYIQGAVAKINPLQPVVDALDNATKQR